MCFLICFTNSASVIYKSRNIKKYNTKQKLYNKKEPEIYINKFARFIPENNRRHEKRKKKRYTRFSIRNIISLMSLPTEVVFEKLKTNNLLAEI